MSKLPIILLGFVAFGGAVSAIAATPSDVIKARQTNFKAIGRANKAIREELQKPSPSTDVARANAPALLAAAKRVANAFPRGTGPESGLPTKALPAIWQDKAGFASRMSSFQKAADAFKGAIARNDPAAIKASFQVLGSTCKTCHETYKARD